MKTMVRFTAALAALLAATTLATPVTACSRVVYLGPSGMVITARSMDWKEDIRSNIWVFPRGMKRDGEAGPSSLKWKSRYGSVTVSAYESATTDGMNEKGLVANLLWLAESEYPAAQPGKKTLAVSLWAQYVLDQFATVAQVVDDLSRQDFIVVTGETPGSTGVGAANVHLSISDATGDSAIFEYIGGDLVIHHGRSYQVMTNSPAYDKQLALYEYWRQIGGTAMLPGTNRAADRFARASFYVDAIPQTDDARLAVASMFSVIRNVSVPLGISTPGQPNISSTRWRVVADQRNRVYYYESSLTPNVFWLDLKDIDFSRRSGVRKLSVINQEIYSGNAVDRLEAAKPFQFTSVEANVLAR
jgi:choloylglycine hydrolase